MSDRTLIFLIDGDRILLAMKKRGFGAGYWNGAGGKLNDNETIEDALVRECQEEINVTPLKYHKVAELDFKFPGDTSDMYGHVYVCDKWDGEPSESEEMAPRWFTKDNLPYDEMWEDDIHWLPQVLKGKKVQGTFTFDSENHMLTYSVDEVQGWGHDA